MSDQRDDQRTGRKPDSDSPEWWALTPEDNDDERASRNEHLTDQEPARTIRAMGDCND
jgi:hypothetical protein